MIGQFVATCVTNSIARMILALSSLSVQNVCAIYVLFVFIRDLKYLKLKYTHLGNLTSLSFSKDFSE
jgi:hypothetical protein